MRVDRRITPPAPSGRPSPFLVALLYAAVLSALPAHAEGPFTVTSDDLTPGGRVRAANVFDRGDCKGGNHSPQLTWHNPPPGTRGYAVTVFDPDAPGHGWWHWAVAGIPATVTSLPADASASGFLRRIAASEARNDFDRRLRRPVPAAGQAAPLRDHRLCARGDDLRVAQAAPRRCSSTRSARWRSAPRNSRSTTGSNGRRA